MTCMSCGKRMADRSSVRCWDCALAMRAPTIAEWVSVTTDGEVKRGHDDYASGRRRDDLTRALYQEKFHRGLR